MTQILEDVCDLDNVCGLLAQCERDLRAGAKAEGAGPRSLIANAVATQIALARMALRGLIGERGAVGVTRAPTDGGR